MIPESFSNRRKRLQLRGIARIGGMGPGLPGPGTFAGKADATGLALHQSRDSYAVIQNEPRYDLG